MDIIRQGYYKEMSCAEDSDPSIYDYINQMPEEYIDRVCDYLKSGVTLIACAGISYDVINHENGIAGIPSVMTDGIWHWPGDLDYYVKNYKLKLPDIFLKTMEENNWTISIELDDIDLEKTSVDGRFLFNDTQQ